jgi:membrane protein DedA with SNARE-associated domain
MTLPQMLLSQPGTHRSMVMERDIMQTWLTDFIERFSYIGIFLLMALENVFPPIPSEVILTFGGFMTTSTELTIPVGSVLGALILYGIGFYLPIKRIEAFTDRWGHILRLKKEDIHRAISWFDKHGYWTILICRMIPLVRSLISIPAGISRMNFWLFLLFTTIGTFIWNITLVLIGAFLGQSWQDILTFMDLYSSIAYALMGVGVLIFLFVLVNKRRTGS